MKRLVSIILSLLMLLSAVNFAVAAETVAKTYIPSKVINLVYDDSGSMIRRTEDGTYVDTWCQAKYAMEVFAAMLSEKDTLNIYYMSDYENDTSAKPKVTLKGSKDASVTKRNVQTIHDLVTKCGNTPFNSVKKAHEDLVNTTADEKWLVVLTDGEFNRTKNSTVENYFDEWATNDSIKIMMLSMGAAAATITPDPDNNIFFEKAESTTDILGKLTGICNRIFQSNALPINSDLTTSFSVPMSQLIVFAQGKEVSIGNITNSDGKEIKPDSNVKVEYSTVATAPHPNYPPESTVVADNLLGYVATFDTEFEPGSYSFDVKGAEDIQVYYKPNVSIAAYLYDGDKEVTAEENLVAGTYRLEFGFINGTSGEKITDTSLLGNIAYASEIVNTTYDGEVHEAQAKSGDNLTIHEGTLDIDVIASFLDYNFVNTKLSYNVYSKNELIFTFEEKHTYNLTTDGFSNPDDAMILTVKLNDGIETRKLSAEQAELMGLPEITTKEALGKFRVETTEEVGKYLVYPTLKDNDPMATATGTIDVTVKGSFTQGMSAAVGKLNDSFEIATNIGMMERIMDWLSKHWLKLLIFLILLFLFLGYIPPFKKYIPRKVKKRPVIEVRAAKIGVKDQPDKSGKFKRSLLSTLIPYKAETGIITFSPSPARKSAQLRAAGGKGIYVTNVKAFAGKSAFTFNGTSIEEGRTKPYRIGASSTISYSTADYNYTCYMNRGK